MRIGFDVSDLATGRADGTTRYTLELAKRLPVLGSEHEWDYFTPDPLKPHPVKPRRSGATGSSATRNVHTHISAWPRYWTQLRLPWDLYRYRPDVLFMPIQQLPIIRPGKMKTAAVIHDLAFHYYPEQFTYKDWLLLHAFSAQAAREADELICVSQATADDVLKFYGRRERMQVIHHGVDYEQFKLPGEEENFRARQNLLEKYPALEEAYILFVGQIQPRKNLVRLIEAFERIATHPRPRQISLNLVIAGSHGWLNEPIKKRATESKLRDRIHMIGRVPDDLLPGLYWDAQVFVLPSLYEGFGMPLLEAMACGCPVVTSNVSSLPEVSGNAAVLVDPLSSDDIARGIREALRRREELRELGLKRAQDFRWEKTASETLKVLEVFDK